MIRTFYCLFFSLLFSLNSAHGANSKKDKYLKSYFTPSGFKVVPLNSPVKEAMAKFKLELPEDMKFEYITVNLVNTRDLRKDQKKFEKVEVQVNSELHIPASKLSPGFYRLYVRVKEKMKNEETQFRTTLHDFARFVVDSPSEVPVPQKKLNDATVEGIDSDNDGIRDDVQRYILEKYSGKVTSNTLQAIKQFAVSYQQKLVEAKDVSSTVYYVGRMTEAMWCMFGIVGPDEKFSDDIQQKILNTKERFQKSLLQRGWYRGHGFPESIMVFQQNKLSDQTYFCDFNP